MTLSLVGIFYLGPVPIRSAQRWSCCVERDAEVRKVCRLPTSSGISCPRRLTGQTTAEGADGTSECPGVSTHERGAEAQSLNPGTSSKPTNPSACGTQAKGCFRGPGSALTTLARWAEPPLVCRYLSTACGLLAWLAGGSRKRPFADAFRTLPWGIRTKRRAASPGANDTRGDDARLWTSAGLFDN